MFVLKKVNIFKFNVAALIDISEKIRRVGVATNMLNIKSSLTKPHYIIGQMCFSNIP